VILCPQADDDITWAEAYLRTKWHFDQSSRLATTDMGRKFGDCARFGEGELDPSLKQCGLGRGLYLRPKFHLDPSNRLATIYQTYRRTGQTGQRNNGLIPREPFCKRLQKILEKITFIYQLRHSM